MQPSNEKISHEMLTWTHPTLVMQPLFQEEASTKPNR